ncbi:craniofacial development protein 2-like [Aplysia californica]|uniref:Craniofacial development protein 2-like n=1 Tax=Aplysia californica TaxID=6500 RepID=A0ABM1AFY7_APLCA|nr:craniofacial development protein 2-like [Aplysia californica]
MASLGIKKYLKERDGRKTVINMNIIQVYAPTNGAEEENKDDFYNPLQSMIDKLPGNNINIVMADLNAKIGSDYGHCEEIMDRYGLGEANDNGERFHNVCAFNNLVIGGTIFPHKRIHKAT